MNRRATTVLSLRCALAVALLVVAAAPAHTAANSGGSGYGRIEDTTIIAGVSFDDSDEVVRCEWSPIRASEESGGQIVEMYQRETNTSYNLYELLCPDQPDAQLRWIPVIDTERLAYQAARVAWDRLPAPWGEFAPPARRGVVRLGTWFWVSPAVWRPVSVTARIPTPRGVVSATATATPTRLTFDPGDGALGSGPVSCQGPGLIWLRAFGDRLSSPCMYTYRHSSVRHTRGAFPASLTITWRVTYSTSVGLRGSLGEVDTAARHDMVVREIQALVRR